MLGTIWNNITSTISSTITGGIGWIWAAIGVGLMMMGGYLGLKVHACTGENGIYGKVAKRMIERNCFDMIIDVRTEIEWKQGHHPLATHIPLQTISEGIKKLDIEKYYLVYCRTGNRAKEAVKIMEKAGFSRVVYLVGGLRDIMGETMERYRTNMPIGLFSGGWRSG